VYIQYYYVDKDYDKFVITGVTSEFHGKITSYKRYDTKLKLDKDQEGLQKTEDHN
jgi:hypothetical protein